MIILSLRMIELCVIGKKLVSKTKFNLIANIHLYGKRSNNFRIIFFGNPRENMYGFYPDFSENKTKQLSSIYQWCENIINGDIHYFDQDKIQFGNCGIPLSYGDLRII